jgi:hypothetical protein
MVAAMLPLKSSAHVVSQRNPPGQGNEDHGLLLRRNSISQRSSHVLPLSVDTE